MKQTTLVAAKDFTLEGTPIRKGSTVAIVQCDLPLERLLNGLRTGAVTDAAALSAPQGTREPVPDGAPPIIDE